MRSDTSMPVAKGRLAIRLFDRVSEQMDEIRFSSAANCTGEIVVFVYERVNRTLSMRAAELTVCMLARCLRCARLNVLRIAESVARVYGACTL